MPSLDARSSESHRANSVGADDTTGLDIASQVLVLKQDVTLEHLHRFKPPSRRALSVVTRRRALINRLRVLGVENGLSNVRAG